MLEPSTKFVRSLLCDQVKHNISVRYYACANRSYIVCPFDRSTKYIRQNFHVCGMIFFVKTIKNSRFAASIEEYCFDNNEVNV